MPIVYPKKVDIPIFIDWSKYSRSFKIPNPDYNRSFARRYQRLLDAGLIEIGTTRYSKRKDKTIYLLGEFTVCKPVKTRRGLGFKIKRFNEKFNSFDL